MSDLMNEECAETLILDTEGFIASMSKTSNTGELVIKFVSSITYGVNLFISKESDIKSPVIKLWIQKEVSERMLSTLLEERMLEKELAAK